jgi:2-keto-4-pentenoate hydratase
VNPSPLAQALAKARRDARLLQDASVPVDSVEAAYAVQDDLVALSGGDVRGWKVTALGDADQARFSSTRPVAAALLAARVHDAPAHLALSSFIQPLLECEVAFVLGADLPARDTPYQRAEIENAIAAVLPLFEVADNRVAAEAPNLLKLADSMGNGELVVGKPVSDWRSIDVTKPEQDIVLTLDGVVVEKGSKSQILGDPLLAVVALANAQPLPAGGLRRGQIVTTGTCTKPAPLRKGEYIADFGALGTVRMTVE